MNLIIENQSFPLINWFKYSFQYSYINLYSCDGYKKMSFRNRYVVAGSNGIISLSVPVEKGRNQRTAFKEVKISYRENWQQNHWRTITSCYNRSPYFEYYQFQLEPFFNNRYEYLFEFNLAVLSWLKGILKMESQIRVINNGDENEIEAVNFTDRWLPKNFQDDESPITYPQVFIDKIGFKPNLSILDMIFNLGPSSATYLQQSTIHSRL